MSEYIKNLHKGEQLFVKQQWSKARDNFQQSLLVIGKLIDRDSNDDTQESVLWLQRYICCSYLTVINGIENFDKVIMGCMDDDVSIQHEHLVLLHRCLQKPTSPIRMLIDHSCEVVPKLIKIVNGQHSQSQKMTNKYIAWQCLGIIGRSKYGFSKLYDADVIQCIGNELNSFIKHDTDDWTYCHLIALSIIAHAAIYQQHRNDLLNHQINIMEIILQYQSTLFKKYESQIIQTFSIKIFNSLAIAINRLSQDRPLRWSKIDFTSMFSCIRDFVSQSPKFNCIPYLYKLMTNITSNLTTRYDDETVFNLMCHNDMYQLLWEHESGLKTFPQYVSLFSNTINQIYWDSDSIWKIHKINKIAKYNFTTNVLHVLNHTMLQLHGTVYFNDNVPHLKYDTWQQCFVVIYNIIKHCTVKHFITNIVESQVFANVLLFNGKLLSYKGESSVIDDSNESFMTHQESLLFIQGYLRLNVGIDTKLFGIKDISHIITNYCYDYSHFNQLSMITLVIHVISMATNKTKQINVVNKYNIVQHLANVLVNVKNIRLKRLIMDVIRDCVNITDDVNDNTDELCSILANEIQNLLRRDINQETQKEYKRRLFVKKRKTLKVVGKNCNIILTFMKTTSPKVQGRIGLIAAMKLHTKTFDCQQWVKFKRILMDEIDKLIEINMTEFMFRLPDSSINKLYHQTLNISPNAICISDCLAKLASLNVLSNVAKFLTKEENATLGCVNRELLVHTHTKSHILNRRTSKDSPLIITYELLQHLPLYAQPNSIQYHYPSNVVCNIDKPNFNINQWLNKYQNLTNWLSFFSFVNHLTIDCKNIFILPFFPIEMLFDVKNKQPINITFKFDIDFNQNNTIKQFGIVYNEYLQRTKKQGIRPINKLTLQNVKDECGDKAAMQIIQIFGENFDQLHLEGCHIMVKSLPQLLPSNVNYLQMSNLTKLYMCKQQANNNNNNNNEMSDHQYHVRTLRIEQVNSVGNDIKIEFNCWTKHSMLNELKHLIVDLNLFSCEGYCTTLICKYGNDYGWLYYLLDPTFRELDCPKIQQIEINVVIAHPTQLCLLIDEIAGFAHLPQYPNQLDDIIINVEFVNYDIDAICDRFQQTSLFQTPESNICWTKSLTNLAEFKACIWQACIFVENCHFYLCANRYLNCQRTVTITAM